MHEGRVKIEIYGSLVDYITVTALSFTDTVFDWRTQRSTSLLSIDHLNSQFTLSTRLLFYCSGDLRSHHDGEDVGEQQL